LGRMGEAYIRLIRQACSKNERASVERKGLGRSMR